MPKAPYTPSASATIRRVRDGFLKKISQGVLLSHSDVLPLANLCTVSGEQVLLCRQESNTTRHKSPSLSLLIRDNDVVSFESRIEVDNTEEWLHSPVRTIRTNFNSRHYRLLGTVVLSKVNQTELGEILDLFFENSVIKLSIDRDQNSSLAERIKEAFAASKRDGLTVLPRLIDTYSDMIAVIARVQSNQILVHVSQQNKEFAHRLAELLSQHNELIMPGPHTYETESGTGNVAELAIKFPSAVHAFLSLHSRPKSPRDSATPQWAAIADAIHFSKQQFFEVSEQRSFEQLVVFPIVTSEIFSRRRIRSRPRYLLIAKSDTGVKKSDLDTIELILHGYTHQRTIANRLQTLAAARRQLQSLAATDLMPEDISYPKLLQLFTEFSTWIARETIEATPAHSMTVRLYDHATRSLKLAASASDIDGNYREKHRVSEISVKEMRLTSLNAFAFVNSVSSDFKHAYLPRVDANDPRIDYIPANLKRLGLKSVLNVRQNTQSEISIPIRYHKIPIGTINIEAPVPEAFEDHFEFLHAIRDNIEEAYERTIGFNDVRSLSRQIATHAAVHELDQYLGLTPPVFNSAQQALLQNLFKLRTTEEPQQIDIKEWLKEWAEHTYSNQTAETVEKIVNLVQVKSIQSVRISPVQWTGLQFLIKNLIQNIVSHGSIEPGEGNSIVIDDRPLYGVGTRELLRVSSKQTAIRDQNILDRVCVAPIFSRNGGARYGMLLIGMITKTLGGQVFVGRDATREFTECLIRLPYHLQATPETHNETD
jgi:hypothetical protein